MPLCFFLAFFFFFAIFFFFIFFTFFKVPFVLFWIFFFFFLFIYFILYFFNKSLKFYFFYYFGLFFLIMFILSISLYFFFKGGLDGGVLTYLNDVNTSEPILTKSNVVYASPDDIKSYNSYSFWIIIQKQALYNFSSRLAMNVESFDYLPETAQIPLPEFQQMLEKIKAVYDTNNRTLSQLYLGFGVFAIVMFIIKLLS